MLLETSQHSWHYGWFNMEGEPSYWKRILQLGPFSNRNPFESQFFVPAASEMVGSRDVWQSLPHASTHSPILCSLKIFSCWFLNKKICSQFSGSPIYVVSLIFRHPKVSWIAPFARTSSLRTPRIGAFLPQLSFRSFRSCWWCQLPFALQGKVVNS